MRLLLTLPLATVLYLVPSQGHDHPIPEKLGTVSFSISCKPAVQPAFNRAVALLHSFTYRAADEQFHHVAMLDPECAMAHWGSAMTHYHQLWDLPPSPADSSAAEQEIDKAEKLQPASERERGFIHAIRQVFPGASNVPYSTRSAHYEAAMHQLASGYPEDPETRIFYALALISNAAPSDRGHERQKEAADLLEPLFRAYPDHPGVPHYLIHACDNQELASRGLVAARVYAGIAPAAPHALHMPSHIFTRLGLWSDSIHSNLAAKGAAHSQGDTGEELHAMDYLMYAYLQSGRYGEAGELLRQRNAMQNLNIGEFKVGYAATALPIRYIVERGKWNEAEKIVNPSGGAPPQVVAVAVWARGLGFARNRHLEDSDREALTLHGIADQLRASGNAYWATQVDIMRREVEAWSAQAALQTDEAIRILVSAADDEDGLEKLPLTPGPILPAREQLGELLLAQGHLDAASIAFKTSALSSPGRRRGLLGAAQADPSPK